MRIFSQKENIEKVLQRNNVLIAMNRLQHQPAPAFFAGVIQLLFPGGHDLFDTGTIGPAGTLAYCQYFGEFVRGYLSLG